MTAAEAEASAARAAAAARMIRRRCIGRISLRSPAGDEVHHRGEQAASIPAAIRLARLLLPTPRPVRGVIEAAGCHSGTPRMGHLKQRRPVRYATGRARTQEAHMAAEIRGDLRSFLAAR